jgi:hypothetical protein
MSSAAAPPLPPDSAAVRGMQGTRSAGTGALHRRALHRRALRGAGGTCAASSSSGGTAVRQPAIMSFAGWLQRFTALTARNSRADDRRLQPFRQAGGHGTARRKQRRSQADVSTDEVTITYGKYFRCSIPRKKVAFNGGNASTEGDTDIRWRVQPTRMRL